MRTVLLFLFLACLSVVVCVVAAAQWLVAHTRPALHLSHGKPPAHTPRRPAGEVVI